VTNRNRVPINKPKEKCQANLGFKTPVLNSVQAPGKVRQVAPGQRNIGHVNQGGT